jgi:hypothetical protein
MSALHSKPALQRGSVERQHRVRWGIRLEPILGGLGAEVLRFELMIERGLLEQPQASGKEAQHETLCRIGRLG